MFEELETDNITMLTTISISDFDKICGVNHLLDCFVFSDIRNIYREKNTLKKLITLFITALKLKFDVNPVEA